MDPDNLSSSETYSGGSNGGKTGKGGKAVYQKGGKSKTKADGKPSWIPSKGGKPSDGEHGGKPSMSSAPQDGFAKGKSFKGKCGKDMIMKGKAKAAWMKGKGKGDGKKGSPVDPVAKYRDDSRFDADLVKKGDIGVAVPPVDPVAKSPKDSCFDN